MRRGRTAIGILSAALLVGAGGARGQGGPPLVTDDPGTPGAGNWEVNVAVTMDHTSLESTWGTPLVDANYGWGERIQLKLELPLVVVSDDSGTRGGIGNPLLGVKWRFLDEEKAGVAISTYPQFGFNVVTASAHRGLADEDPHFLLPVSAVKSLGALDLNVEVGRTFRSGGVGEWVWGVAAGHHTGPVELLAEVFGSSGSSAEPRQVVLNLGGRVPVSTSSTILASAGWSLSDGDGLRHVFVYLGLQLTARKGAP